AAEPSARRADANPAYHPVASTSGGIREESAYQKVLLARIGTGLSADAIDSPEECRRRKGIELKRDILAGANQCQVCFRNAHFGGHLLLVNYLGEGIARLDHHASFLFNFRRHHHTSDRRTKIRGGDALLFEIHLGSVKVGAHFGLSRSWWIIAKFRFR